MTTQLFAVIGDVHHHIGLAAEGLDRLEAELGRPIAQVFSVGDLGLFLSESDWEFLTGPKKYRCPEESPAIRRAWASWRWPLSMIAGNHEPFHRLRDWDPAHFSAKLAYTNAGELAHVIPGLRVAGLSGIYHPQEGEFLSRLERRTLGLSGEGSWPEMVALARDNRISRSRLTSYKDFEVDLLKGLPRPQHLLLLHDWPVTPPHLDPIHDRRPEAEIVAALNPEFVCCGHHHRAAEFSVGSSRIFALNIITSKEGRHRHRINPGWCALFESNDQGRLEFRQTWPE